MKVTQRPLKFSGHLLKSGRKILLSLCDGTDTKQMFRFLYLLLGAIRAAVVVNCIQVFKTVESFGLEKTLEIIESNH